jgi:hypothetical protein
MLRKLHFFPLTNYDIVITETNYVEAFSFLGEIKKRILNAILSLSLRLSELSYNLLVFSFAQYHAKYLVCQNCIKYRVL